MLEVRSDGISQIGSREVNEDAYVIKQDDRGRYLYAVADGLGGHGRGEVASQTAVQAIAACFDRWDEQTPLRDFLNEAMWSAQNEIMRLRSERGEVTGMLTTCVLLVISGDRAMWAHVGDSRLYLLQGTQIQWTKDHSVPQMLVQQNCLTQEEIRFHPDRNKILRAMGNEWEKPKFDLSEEICLRAPAAFLLCSDGFWELIEEPEMCSLYSASETPDVWLRDMLRVVQQEGVGKNMDNHTAIAVFVQPDSAPERIVGEAQTAEVPQIRTRAKPKPVTWIAAAAAALLLLLIVLLVYRSGKTDNGPTEPASSETQSTQSVESVPAVPVLPAQTAAPSVSEPQVSTDAAVDGGDLTPPEADAQTAPVNADVLTQPGPEMPESGETDPFPEQSTDPAARNAVG